MAECEVETVTVAVNYYVDAEIDGITGAQRFGPVHSCGAAENLLLALSARSNVNKATLVKETV